MKKKIIGSEYVKISQTSSKVDFGHNDYKTRQDNGKMSKIWQQDDNKNYRFRRLPATVHSIVPYWEWNGKPTKWSKLNNSLNSSPDDIWQHSHGTTSLKIHSIATIGKEMVNGQSDQNRTIH